MIFLTSFLQIQFLQYGVELPTLFFYFLTTFVIVPLSFVRNLHFFHQVSQFGFLLALLSLALVAGNCLWLFVAGPGLQFSEPFKPLSMGST